jgi:peptide/nickel transport system substrate-binding protein
VASLFSEVDKVEAPSDDTVVVEMKRPFAVFLDNITDPRAAIVNAEAADEMGAQFGRKPVLTGPWKVTDYVSGESITLTRNPDYNWSPGYAHEGPPYIQTLEFRIIPDDATMVSALQAGDVQIVDTLPPAQVEQFKGDDQYELHSFLRKGVGLFLEFNVTKLPFDDAKVREALNHAIDRQQLVQVVLRGLGQEACGPLPPSIDGYWDGICRYAPDYDPERAKQLLEQAGYREGSDGMLEKNGKRFSFTLFNTPIDTWTQSAQLVQQQLKDIGIDMKIQNFEFGTLLSKLQAGDQQAHFMGYTYTTPDILYLWFHSSNIGNGLNLSHIDERALDSLLEDSRAKVDREARLLTYQDIQKYLVDKRVWVPLWTNEDVSATRSEVGGEQISNEGYLVLLDAYVHKQ